MYFGGVAPSLRKEVWPFLLGHYKFSMSEKCRREVLLVCFQSIKIYSHAYLFFASYLHMLIASDWWANAVHVRADYEGVAGLRGHCPSEGERETCRGTSPMLIRSQRGKGTRAAGLHHQYRCKFEQTKKSTLCNTYHLLFQELWENNLANSSAVFVSCDTLSHSSLL